MTKFNYSQNTKFADKIRQIHGAEVKGSELYFLLIYMAKEKGLHDLADAMLKNACEDAQHGGMYATMLGKGKESEEELWKQAVRLYKLEASAQDSLQKLADEIRASGETELADCVASTIEEENEHARRLKAVFDAHGISY